MAHHRDQAKFDRAQWRLAILVPSWLLQISLYIVLIGMSAYLLASPTGLSDGSSGTVIAWQSITIGFAAISILCTAFEILRTFAEALTPKEMAVSNLIKLVGILVSLIMGALMSGSHLSSWVTGTQIIHGLLIIPVISLGSYAGWTWTCLAQYDGYDHPGNVKPFGFKSDRNEKLVHPRNESDDWDVELRASWASRQAALGNAVDLTSPAPAAPAPEPAATEPRARGPPSFVRTGGRLNFSLTRHVDGINDGASRSRANSSSALLGGTAPAPQSPPAGAAELLVPRRPVPYISMTGTGLDRRASYNHTRDTAFDEYVRQHRSRQQQMGQGPTTPGGGRARSISAPLARNRAASLTAAQQQKFKDDVDDALSTAFGWANGSRSSSLDSVMAGGSPPAIAVGGGAVPNARLVRDSLGRAPSDGSERGALGSMPEAVDEAAWALLGGRAGDEEMRAVPESLRPACGGMARPRALSETITFVVTPPPATPTAEGGGGARKTWGAAYQP